MPSEQRLTASDRPNLVAYLDGELAEVDSQSLTTKLTHSATARRELQALERTWELLDFLPRPRASPELASRTLSQARQQEQRGEHRFAAAGQSARRVVQVVLAAVFVTAALGLGYVATRWLWPDPTARLARDLSIAEDLDTYRAVGSFEFLRKLDATFTDDEP